jgi:hypothetical protein
MENLKKAYYLFFYKLYLVFNYLSEDSWGYWKAGLVIQTLQYFILFVIIMQIEIISKNYVIPDFDPKLWEIPLAIILAVFNYYVFLYKKDWKQYIDEFSRYSKKKNIIINIIIFFIVFGIVSLLIFTFYQYSQIEWIKNKI